jgi:hypothetical protein
MRHLGFELESVLDLVVSGFYWKSAGELPTTCNVVSLSGIYSLVPL